MTTPSVPPAGRSRRGILAGAPATQAIVLVTVACWLVDLIPGVELGRVLGFSPLVSATEPWRALTVMLVHADAMHLMFNMIGVVLFGGFVERALGTVRYLGVYLLSGLGGSAAVLLLAEPFQPDWFALHVGASGAVFGLLGVVLTPTRVLDRNWGGAAIFLIINVVYSVVSPGISWQSHAGGLVVGFALGCAALLPRSRDAGASEGVPGSAGVRVRGAGLWFWAAAGLLLATMLAAALPGLRASSFMAG